MSKGSKSHTLPDIDIMDMRAFHATVTEGSQKKAAMKLGVTQPLISYRNQNMENFFKQQLFYRATNRQETQVTPFGKELYSYVDQTLTLIDEMIIMARSYNVDLSK
jgi:DNA-binding transcriptional LysR family regulator